MAQRAALLDRSGGRCERACGRAVTINTFHVAELVGGSPGAAANLQAWCSPCYYEDQASDILDRRLAPRQWQIEALDRIVERIGRDGTATVVAAPGAGKTVFAGLVFEALYEAGLVERMVVFAPKTNLVAQWAAALWDARKIQLKPDDALERRGQHGVVLTYAALQNPQTVEVLRLKSDQVPTLVVLDEVHHVGDPLNGQARAWARNLEKFAGAVDNLNVRGVLNLSGTLWRSAPGEVIPTVRYETLPNGKMRALHDHEETADVLILGGELRSIDLYKLDARIRASDLSELNVVDSDMADLDDEDVSRFALRAAATDPGYRQSFVANVLARLRDAQRSLDNYHVKALIVASRQDDARAFADEVNRQMAEFGMTPLAVVATSDDAGAAKTLKDFREQKRAGVLCTVDMAGEGYDCPDIVVVGYATNKLTTLYVRQVVARAMRVTDKERSLGWIHPAVIVTPDIQLLVDKLVAYLAPFMHEVVAPEEIGASTRGEGGEGEEVPGGQGTMWPRFELQDLVPGAESVTYPHLDGTRYDFEGAAVAAMAKELSDAQLPPSWAPRVLAVTQRMGTVGDLLNARPLVPVEVPPPGAIAATPPPVTGAGVEPPRAFDNIEARAQMIQQALHKLEKWWHVNGGTSAAVLAGQANAAAGIAIKGGRKRADLPRLARALEFEQRACAARARELNIPLPRGVRSDA